MNYIRHLHAFYQQVKRDDRLSSGHVSLYLAIFQFWNYNRFQNPFRINREELMALSKIGSKNTYHKCMKELHSFQYIVYHTTLTKYQPVKLSIIRLDLKNEENAFQQLDLFTPRQEEPITITSMPEAASSQSASEKKFDAGPGTCMCQKQPTTSTGFDTHACTETGTHTCLKIGTAHVPLLTAASPRIETTRVPILGPLLKHKHLNSKHCVFKTGHNTPTTIFKKNSNLQNAITELAEIKRAVPLKSQDTRLPPVPVHVEPQLSCPDVRENEITLNEVEVYFQQNRFPKSEAQKFFFYNKGRGWMLTDTLCIKDWMALAQKWMLNDQTFKTVQNGTQGKDTKPVIDPGPGKDYSEPL